MGSFVAVWWNWKILEQAGASRGGFIALLSDCGVKKANKFEGIPKLTEEMGQNCLFVKLTLNTLTKPIFFQKFW